MQDLIHSRTLQLSYTSRPDTNISVAKEAFLTTWATFHASTSITYPLMSIFSPPLEDLLPEEEAIHLSFDLYPLCRLNFRELGCFLFKVGENA
jgi:hypothetical protein